MPSSGPELKSKRSFKRATATPSATLPPYPPRCGGGALGGAGGNKPADATYQVDKGSLRVEDPVKDSV
jgi:hypothetical protein